MLRIHGKLASSRILTLSHPSAARRARHARAAPEILRGPLKSPSDTLTPFSLPKFGHGHPTSRRRVLAAQEGPGPVLVAIELLPLLLKAVEGTSLTHRALDLPRCES